jgi:uncharacterized protein GlcG (DUF336 family)
MYQRYITMLNTTASVDGYTTLGIRAHHTELESAQQHTAAQHTALAATVTDRDGELQRLRHRNDALTTALTRLTTSGGAASASNSPVRGRAAAVKPQLIEQHKIQLVEQGRGKALLHQHGSYGHKVCVNCCYFYYSYTEVLAMRYGMR